MSRARFVGDWGTTRLRLLHLDGVHVIERREGTGIGRLTGVPADMLLATLGDWAVPARETGITLCGMAGSRNGLIEAPYLPCPARAGEWAARIAPLSLDGIAVRVAAGLSAVNFAGGADVMLGEETQIFGAIDRDPDLAIGRHVLVMPGTHSKWAVVEDGAVVRFHTAFTGELFALLRDHSTLTRAGGAPERREAGFAAGLARIRQTGALSASLFEARAAQLIDGRTQDWAIGFLSGLAIGAEIIDITRLAQIDDDVTLIGGAELNVLYATALAAFGRPSRALDGDDCVSSGLALLEGMA